MVLVVVLLCAHFAPLTTQRGHRVLPLPLSLRMSAALLLLAVSVVLEPSRAHSQT